MTFEGALRATEVLLAWALIQQSVEHLTGPRNQRALFALRMGLSIWVCTGLATSPPLVGLCAISLYLLHHFQGPYNGGSDRMGMLILFCLTLANVLPQPVWAQTAFAYLAVQVTLSYFISGWVKIRNPDWRAGRALCDVFAFSAYPVSEGLRRLADFRGLLWGLSWAVIGFELLFPLAVLHPKALYLALALGAAFHLSNALLFGLNRFFWTWIAAYPALIWLQARLITGSVA